jgi:hypothetical protein
LNQIKDTNNGFICPRPAGFYYVNNLFPPQADIVPRFVLFAAKNWEAALIFKAKTKSSKIFIVTTMNFQGEIVSDDLSTYIWHKGSPSANHFEVT